MRAIEEEIPEGLSGERVDRVVSMIADVSRSVASKLVADGAVTIDGSPVTSGSRKVVGGQTIRFEVSIDAGPVVTPDPSVQFEIAYSDDHVLVIDKPAGLVVHPGAGNPVGTLVNGLISQFPEIADVGEAHRPGIVHRLDRGTSGLLVVARTAEAHASLVQQMTDHEPERIYTALAWGAIGTPAGVIDAPIGRSNRHPTRKAVVQGGRRAVTHYKVDQVFAQPRPVTLVTCRLETGRTHQIRVHLGAIGHPVVGDREYGGGRPGIEPGRPFLHARMLTFVHPVTGDTISVESEMPSDLGEVLASLS